ncbi:MAG: hypothetical protein JO089_07680 [Alphaproteobacteria bacterium]|nr:hypothetical protein [Alphaproteobacteria bacterium]
MMYAQTFIDAALSGFVLPLRADAAFFALREFGRMSVGAVAAAVLGRVCIHALHWGMGRALRVMRDRGKIYVRLTPKLETIAPRVLAFALLFTWWGLGAVWPFFAGFFRMKLPLALALVAIGQAGYYTVSAYWL